MDDVVKLELDPAFDQFMRAKLRLKPREGVQLVSARVPVLTDALIGAGLCSPLRVPGLHFERVGERVFGIGFIGEAQWAGTKHLGHMNPDGERVRNAVLAGWQASRKRRRH